MTLLLALLAGGCVIVGGALCITPRPTPIDPMIQSRRAQATHLHALVEAYATAQPLDDTLRSVPSTEHDKVASALTILAEVVSVTIATQRAERAKRQQRDYPTPDWLQ